MADFGTVSGAFSVISFAGQLLQGIQFLIGFYGDIVSAPDYIKDLNTDLRTLEALLKDIISLSGSTTASTATSPSAKPSLRQALDQCQRHIERLTNLTLPYKYAFQSSKTRKMGARLTLSLRDRPKLEKAANKVAQSKSTLLLAYLSVALCQIAQLGEASKEFQTSISALRVNQGRVFDITSETHASITTIKTYIEDMEKRMAKTLLSSDGQNNLQITTLVSQAVPSKGEIASRMEANTSSNSLTPQSQLQRELPAESSRKGPGDIENLPTTKRIRLGETYTRDTSTGKVLSHTEEHREGTRRVRTITRLMYLPKPAVSLVGLVVTITRSFSAIRQESPKYALRPLEIIPPDAPLLKAIETGDTACVEQLLSQRLTSPFVCTSDGDNLLYFLASQMFEFLFELFKAKHLDPANLERSTEGKIRRRELKHAGSERWVKWKQLFHLFINLGVDAGSYGPHVYVNYPPKIPPSKRHLP
jgi:hypothetical protein